MTQSKPLPATLGEAVVALHNLLSEEDRDFVLKSEQSTDDMASGLHHSFGRYLRNTWKLWGSSPLAEHLRTKHGVTHPDDMSHFLIVEYVKSRTRSRFDREPPV